jgi:hypothetical protein
MQVCDIGVYVHIRVRVKVYCMYVYHVGERTRSYRMVSGRDTNPRVYRYMRLYMFMLYDCTNCNILNYAIDVCKCVR